MRSAFVIAFAVAAGASASADSLHLDGFIYHGAVTGDVHDPADHISLDVYIGGDYGTLTIGANTISLAQLYCVDLVDQIHLPTTYDVNVSVVDNAQAWLASNIGPTVTDAAQDAGLQLAEWYITYNPGITFSNVTGEGGPFATDPTYWEDQYLIADGFGSKIAYGYLLSPTTSYGQVMVIAPPSGGITGLPGVPAPLAALPFLVGLSRKRRR